MVFAEPAAGNEGRIAWNAGVEMGLLSGWNRSRATALGVTLLLHALAAIWLLAPRPVLPARLADDLNLAWFPVPPIRPAPPALPVGTPTLPTRIAPITASPLPMPEVGPLSLPDWSETAREVAKGMAAGPSRHRFGEIPEGPAERPRDIYPPSIWAQPLPRVGTTVTTPEGETIIWVSDDCFVSISSHSIALKEVHEARRGVRTCILARFGDRKKPRGDLFDAIKRPPPPQEPGCGPDGIGQSCGR